MSECRGRQGVQLRHERFRLGFQTLWLHSIMYTVFELHRLGLGSVLPISA